MFKEFSKILYNLDGKTMEFTDIFKSVNVDTSNYTNISEKNNNIKFRPDQFSNQVYGDSKLLWSLFLLNGVRNPFKEWNQSEEAIKKQNQAESDVFVFQFGNTSDYLPKSTNAYFTSSMIDSYDSVDLSGIEVGDILIYETGGGPDQLKIFGCGTFDAGHTCGSPHFGQSIIPDNFIDRNNIKDISAGENFSSCLDNNGKIWAWGENIGLTKSGFVKNIDLYSTQTGGYTTISSTNKIIGTKNNQWWCWGDGCSATSYPITESKTINKTSWTKGVSFGGIILFSDKTIKMYGGITGNSGTNDVNETYDDVSCSLDYCVGLTLNSAKIFAYPDKFVTAPAETNISSISCGKYHCVLTLSNGSLAYLINNGQDSITVQFTDSDTWSTAGAGLSFSTAINSNNEIKFAGKLLVTTGGPCGTTSYANINNIVKGKYDKLSVGDNHVMMLGTGDTVRHFGRVTAVDYAWKRIFVESYTAPNKDILMFDDPNSTNVLIYRNNILNKSVQHKLLSIDSYYNTIQNIISADYNISGVTSATWKSVIGSKKYLDHANQASYITPLKQQTEIINSKNNIKYIVNDDIYLLEQQLNNLVKTQNRIQIKLSDL